jgi:hypothetical protein
MQSYPNGIGWAIVMLTEGAVRDAEPREKTYKMSDTGGLFVMVNPDGVALVAAEVQIWGERARDQPGDVSVGVAEAGETEAG